MTTDISNSAQNSAHYPVASEITCPRCDAPLVSDELHVGPKLPPDGREVIYAERFICGTWNDPQSPIYKACSYIQTIQARYAPKEATNG